MHASNCFYPLLFTLLNQGSLLFNGNNDNKKSKGVAKLGACQTKEVLYEKEKEQSRFY